MKTGKNPMYRMPIVYGPATGPRRGPDGDKFDETTGRECFKYTISFLTDRKQLEDLLPPGFSLAGEPIVSVYTRYKKNIQWLGGRGYNVVNVSFPAVFKGKNDTVAGDFASVVWENLTEPILTGREELGCPKIFADIPDPMEVGDTTYCSASWMGFKFMDFVASGLRAPTEEENREYAARTAQSQGILYYKYIPKSGLWGTPEAEYPVLNPKGDTSLKVLQTWVGDAKLVFHRPTWQEMPTQYMIVNALADLEVRKMLCARVIKTVGGKDLSDVRILS